MRWEEHTVRIRDQRNAYKVLVEKNEKRDHVEYLNVDGTIIF
jgi:hypothetical protein